MSQALDEPGGDRIGDHGHNDRDGLRPLRHGLDGRGGADHDDVDLEGNELGGQR
jgi:hypothetical protein